MEILAGRGKGDAAKPEIAAGGQKVVEGRVLGGVDAGEADEFLGEAVDVFGNVAVGNFGSQIFAFESEDDGLIDDGGLCPMVVGVGGGDGRQFALPDGAILGTRPRLGREASPKSSWPSCSGDCQMCV